MSEWNFYKFQFFVALSIFLIFLESIGHFTYDVGAYLSILKMVTNCDVKCVVNISR